MSAYRSLILDVDSTLCGIEGVDWLAERRGAEVARQVVELTNRAMSGEIGLDAVYGERLRLIEPSANDVAALAQAYEDELATGAAVVLRRLRGAGLSLILVSGGIRQGIAPVAAALGFADADLHAVRVAFDERGAYVGFDTGSPLATQGGKREVAAALALPRPVLAVGDGATDLVMRPAVDAFAAFTGFVTRPPVVAAADHVVTSFDQLAELALK